MNHHPLPQSHKEVITIVEQLQRVGFPNTNNIAEIEKLVQKLDAHASKLEHLHQISIKQLDALLQKIKTVLKSDPEIPVRMYSSFYAQLVIFDTNLHTFF